MFSATPAPARHKNSDDAREDAVQLAGLGGVVEDTHQPVPLVPEKQQKKDNTSASSEKKAAEKESEQRPGPSSYTAEKKRGVCAVERGGSVLPVLDSRQEKKGGLCRR